MDGPLGTDTECEDICAPCENSPQGIMGLGSR